MSRGSKMSGLSRLFWVLLLALACGPALALGLGQIEVKSRPGEPLLAEIPIVSSDPSELEQLQARLASPETFARVGLEPPSGLVQDLQFTIGLDGRGRPVIRVTTQAPVQQPLLTFLLEVDWGQGRLVREYSALIEAPETVAAVAQPPIEAPVPAPSSTIVREPLPAGPAPGPEPEGQVAQAAADSGAPAPAPAPAPARPEAAAVSPGQALPPVRRGQTLSGIARSLAAQTGRSLDQAMIALLRANPEAFIRGNINLLREGAVLRVPGEAEWNAVDAREATALVREHIAQWREMRRAVPQPVEASGVGAQAATAPKQVDARLEIVPPMGDSAQAGTRSGIAAGGEGKMLQQELIQTRETLAAREAEIEELKARVAELEQLQQKQQQLIAMKDSELAAAQQRLAQQNERQQSSTLPWVWIGVALCAVALLAWWLGSRRGASARGDLPDFLSPPRKAAAPKPAAPVKPAAPAAPAGTGKAPSADAAATLAASGWPSNTPDREAPADAPADTAPTWHAATQDRDNGAARAATVAPLNPAPAGQERIELARAYLDLGDVDTARSLLQEVVDNGDPAARGEAARLLRDLA